MLRFTLPHADPYLFPLFAVLACFGLVMIYRIDEDLAREQAQWFVVGLILFAATIILLRDYRVLERYRYTIAAAGIALLLLPRVPGIGQNVNGAYLGVGIGPLSFQPAEFAKIAIIIFLASYLRDTRQLLVTGGRRFLGITIPPLKHFGPLLLVWGVAMAMLFFIQDIGSSLMFFGGFLAVVYVATNRVSFVAVGLALFAVGLVGPLQHPPDDHEPHRRLAAPVRGALRQGRAAATSSPSRCSRRPTAGSSGRASASRCSRSARGDDKIVSCCRRRRPTSSTRSSRTSSGCSARRRCICTYLLAVERGFKIATLARDSFSKLLATGLTAVFALQVFVIVGGVTQVIPLTGVTLPFISYGGSSILANFVLLALLLLVSERARAEAELPSMNAPHHPPLRRVPAAVRGARRRHVVEHGVPRRRRCATSRRTAASCSSSSASAAA